ncbi:hypothetical protein Rs2_21412 [Raphanus sativus]|nr:hypothetical protein Rs2_21412 [Raphanus sativus]
MYLVAPFLQPLDLIEICTLALLLHEASYRRVSDFLFWCSIQELSEVLCHRSAAAILNLSGLFTIGLLSLWWIGQAWRHPLAYLKGALVDYMQLCFMFGSSFHSMFIVMLFFKVSFYHVSLM